MAVLIAPFESEASVFDVRVVMDGVPYRFDCRYNAREKAWYFDVKDDSGVPIRSGVKITNDSPLLQRLVSTAGPAGAILAISQDQNDGTRAKEDDLGVRVPVFYVEEETVQEVLSG